MADLSQEYEGLSISISFSYEKKLFVHKVVHEKGKFQYNLKKINSIFNINKAFSHIKAASLITDRRSFFVYVYIAQRHLASFVRYFEFKLNSNYSRELDSSTRYLKLDRLHSRTFVSYFEFKLNSNYSQELVI